MMQQQRYFSDAQVAARYGVSRATVWRWVHRGRVIISETVFKNRKAIGRIFADSNSGLFSFVPADGKTRLPDRIWKDPEELRQAIHEVYKDESPPV